MVQQQSSQRNALNELGYKIFLDRYAQKDMTRSTLQVGDLVIVVVDSKSGQREIGTVTALNLPQVTIQLRDGETVTRDIEHVDKPIETRPEEMMDRVARGVAANEKGTSLQEEWTRNFRWLLDGWRFVPGGRILTAAGTDQELTYYNCMPPEQEILTADGYRPIGDVHVGDYVVTHRNRLRRVLHKFERETEEPLYIIKPRKVRYDDVRLTGDHKVLVIRSEWVNTHRSRDGINLQQAPAWIPAKELRAGDYVALAFNGTENSLNTLRISDYIGVEGLAEEARYTEGAIVTQHSAYETVGDRLAKVKQYRDGTAVVGKKPSIKNELILDEALAYVFGRWVGDGCIVHRTGTDIPAGIKIVFGLDELAAAEEIAQIIEDKFDIPAAIKLSSTGRWYDLWVNSMPLGEFFKSFLGVYSYEKLLPNELMTLPKALTVALLRGVFSADGYISGNYLGIVLSNRALAAQIHQLLLRLGYLFSIRENTHRLGKHPAYRLSGTVSGCSPLFEAFFDTPAPTDSTRDQRYYIEYDDLKWVRIEQIETELYKGTVLDIEVEEDHSLVTAGVVVSNCYVIPSPNDSREGIIRTLGQMTEIMSRGGGVGINISSLRPRHAYVKGVNGRSSGSVSWGALYSFVTGLIEQGGSRRGALMLILNDWHPDVFDFINSKRQMGNITNANISVGVSDKLMEAVKADGDWELVFPDTSDPEYDEFWNGDLETWIASGRKILHYKTVKAREVWHAIIESAWASAEPGVWFRERSNKMANSWYFNPLIATNPCVTGDTRIYTDKGMVKAIDLFNDETQIEAVIDGRFGLERATTPATRVFRTGHKPVYRLQTREGYFLRATADHRIMTPRGWVELQDLQPGDDIHILNRKGGFGAQGSLELGRVLGWLVGDDTLKADRAALSFFGDEKRELAHTFAQYVTDIVEPMTTRTRAYTVGVVEVADRDEARVQSERLRRIAEEHGLVENKFQVPEVVYQGTEDMQRGFLQALFTADGSVQRASGMTTVRLASSHLALLQNVQQVLSNFGIFSKIYQNRREAQFRDMPDGKGGTKSYWTQAQHELVISRSSILTFATEIGFVLERKQTQLLEYIAAYKNRPRPDSFAARVESITLEGTEDVYDLTEPLTSSFIANSLVIHNCGEQPLGGFSVCNLGALNLAQFYDEEKHDVHWEDLRRAVKYAIRFLDNIIDTTPYFFNENRDVQLGERRVGLGTMGIAELMIRLGIRYGSDESVEFIEKVYHDIARAAYLTSAEIAQEKGTFPMFDAEKFLESGFMQMMDEDVVELIRERGIRNVTLLTQAPTGCVAPDTLVSTSNGLRPIVTLGNPDGEQWQALNTQVYTDEGLRATSHFYINGVAPVKTVTTKHGFTVTATHNHRIRVIDAAGNYVWRRMDEIQPNDKTVLKRNTIGTGSTVMLSPVAPLDSASPQTLTPALAELLGLYMGDSAANLRGGLNIPVNAQDADLLAHVQDLMQQVWGARNSTVEAHANGWTVRLADAQIARFFEVNGLAKSNDNSAFIPMQVLQAGRDVVTAFLRGVFESGGSAHRATITAVAASESFARQMQIALLGVGVVTALRAMPSTARYELRVLNRDEAVCFVEQVGFASQRKQAQSAVWERSAQPRAVGAQGALTQQFVKQMVAAQPTLTAARLALVEALDVYIDAVDSITDGVSATYDLSVPDNKTYIANGFVSHNTTGTMVNTSTGIEPFFSWVYYRKSRLGLHEEQVPLVKEFYENNPQAGALPEYFVTAMDLAPEEHVKVQGAFQKWIDSAISKTCNVPNHYTVEQVAALYEYMYDLGCKGGTIYRDGSRDEQVLMLKKDDEPKEEKPNKEKSVAAQVATPHHVYPRPNLLTGATVKAQTPFGRAYITMNADENGNPFEVFITAPGKAGSDLQADAEGLGRMISLSLRTTAPQNRREMLKLVIEQLRDIGGTRSVGFGPQRVSSLPDAVARALEEHFFPKNSAQQLELPMVTPTSVPAPTNGTKESESLLSGADMCPSCGTISLIRAEGCRKCLTCDYTEC